MARRRSQTSDTITLGVYKRDKNVRDLEWASDGSACFDVRAYLPVGELITVYNHKNKSRTIAVRHMQSIGVDCIILDPQDRALIPTGMFLDIPEGYSLRLHPRSGIALKQGLVLANCEGVIDSDYVNELYIAIKNDSGARVIIQHEERLAQGELEKSIPHDKIKMVDLEKKPAQKTTRTGGFGSTGKK